MSNPVKVNGATGGSDTAANAYKWLGGGNLLYAQPSLYPAPVPYKWYGARWLYLRGGTYNVKAVAEQKAELSFNDGESLPITASNKATFKVTLPAGYNKLKLSVENNSYNASSYIGISMTRQGEAKAEYFSMPSGFSGDLEGYPDIGAAPKVVKNINYPVWPTPPNWDDSVSETFEWFTNILSSESGAEQRRKVRLLPRRSISFSVAEWHETQRIFDISAAVFGQDICLLPIYFDKQWIRDDIKKGDLEVYGDFTNRPDYYATGTAVLLDYSNPLVNEVLVISEVHDDKIVLNSPVKSDWAAGVIIHPIVRARVSNFDSVSRPTSDVMTSSVTFEVVDNLAIKPVWNYCDQNASTGLNVLTGISNNWKEATTVQMTRNVAMQDNSVSTKMIIDSGGDTSTVQRMSVMIQGREQYAKMLETLYAMAGRYSRFQFPTRFNDIELARDIAHHEGYLACKKSGYSAFKGASQYVRQWFMVCLYSGDRVFGRVISVDTDDRYDYLVLEQAIGNIMKKDILMVCWCPISRLGSDSVEIQHSTDIDGVAQTVLAINSFHDRRKV